MSIPDKSVGDASELLKQRDELVIVVVRRESVLEEHSLARRGFFETSGLVSGLIRDDEVVEQVASLLHGFNQIGSEESVGNLGALAHDGQPLGQLGVILGGSQGDVVSVITQLLHAGLVDNSPDKAVKGALAVLGTSLNTASSRRESELFLAIKRINGCLHEILGAGESIGDQGQSQLNVVQERVESLGKSDLDVHKGNILAASRVRGELEERLLLDEGVGIEVGVERGHAPEADGRELSLHGGGMSLDPSPGLGAVCAHAKHVEQEDDGGDDKDDALGLKLGQRVALMDVVPFRPDDLAGGLRGSSGQRRSLGGSFRDGIGSSSKFGKV